MRTYSRTINPDGTYAWRVVTTDANGFDDEVWAVTLIQSCKLGINESPFFSNYGIPSAQAVRSGIPPDNYISNLQSLFAPRFANLTAWRIAGSGNPSYRFNIVFQNGAILTADTLDGWVSAG